MNSIDRIVELRKQIFQIQYNHWTNNTLFSLKWWIMVSLVVAYWFIWWKISDKKKFNEIGLAGLTAALLNFFLNTTGIEMTFWAYPSQIFGLVRTWSLFELSFISITSMLLYQYFLEWKKYLIALVVLGAFGAFVAQPLLIYVGIYKLYNWRNLYSFPIYIFMGVIVKFITTKIIEIQKSSTKQFGR